jgi:RES domain-containing protein
VKLPPITNLRRDDTSRLVPSKYAVEGQSPLTILVDEENELRQLSELESATDDRLLGESGLLPGIGIHELVFGVLYAHIVNAAFTYARPQGSRFNGEGRGAWYAAFRLETARAEVAFHRGRELQEINWPHKEGFDYIEYLADFRAAFHDIRNQAEFRDCLAADTYASSQRLAQVLLTQRSAGIVYPSVREKRHGSCLACFRPVLVTNVRRGVSLTITFENAAARPVFVAHS